MPDFNGSLDQRLAGLASLTEDKESLLLIGSSFGGLMATCFAANHGQRVKKLILMAPALNFPGLTVPAEKIDALTYLLIGRGDTVTPAKTVIPLAEKTFAQLEINLVDEDHLLHTSFPKLDWPSLLEVRV